MKRIAIPVAAAAAAVLAAAPATSQGEQGATVIQVAMTGEAESGPGDPDGTGRATIRINARKGELCYQLRVDKIDPATAAHIHIAPPETAGPVVVPLDAPTDGSSKGCATVTETLARAIIANPGAYYINVHNAAFPGGAVRGQLG